MFTNSDQFFFTDIKMQRNNYKLVKKESTYRLVSADLVPIKCNDKTLE